MKKERVNIQDNFFYKLNNFKEQSLSFKKVILNVINTRTLFNLHKSVRYYNFLKNKKFENEMEKLDFESYSEKDLEEFNPIEQLYSSMVEKWFSIRQATFTILIFDICLFLSAVLNIFFGTVLFFFLILFSFNNYKSIFNKVKRTSLYGPKMQEDTVKTMKRVELFSIFTLISSIILVIWHTFDFLIYAYLITVDFLNAASIMSILNIIVILIAIMAGAFVSNTIRTYIQYDLSVRQRYLYVPAEELWTPETSINESDKDRKHVIVGHVDANRKKPYYLRFNDLNTHHLAMGGTGSGKSALTFLPLIAQFLGIHDTGIIVIDPKGDLIEDMRALTIALQRKDKILEKRFEVLRKEQRTKLKQKIKSSNGLMKQYYIYKYYKNEKKEYKPYIDPKKKIMIFDPKDVNCPWFNPLKGSLEQAQKLFKAIILAGSDENSFFDAEGEALLTNAINVLKTLEQAQTMTDGIKSGTVAAIRNEFNNSSIFTKHVDFYLRNTDKMKKYNAWAEEVIQVYQDLNLPNMDVIETSLSSMKDYAAMDKTFQVTNGLRTKVSKIMNNKHLNYIYNPDTYAQEQRDELDFKDIIAGKGIIGIATRQEILTDRYARTLGLSLILVLQQTLMSIPLRERNMMQVMIDEFQVFANDDMGILLNQGRSYKVCMHLATQTSAQIDLYTKGLKDTVLGNTFYKTLFASLNAEDVAYFMKEAGTREVETISITGTRVNKNTGIQDNDHIMQKKKERINNIDPDKFVYGQNQFGYMMGRYILARRRPQYVRFAFIDDWIKKDVKKLQNIAADEYMEILKTNARKYLASNLDDIEFVDTGFEAMLKVEDSLASTDIFA